MARSVTGDSVTARFEKNMSKVHPEVVVPNSSGYSKRTKVLTEAKVGKKLEVKYLAFKWG